MGGFDLCFGRWDTAQHVLIDDPDAGDGPQIWPGTFPRLNTAYVMMLIGDGD